ncbi:MAG: primosomal protein N' [Proteobacteria bacterium]|nr:primosomal protein N' [Pseudomonadota bacterium]
MPQSSLKQSSLLHDSAPRAQVLVPYPLARAYDYRVPDGMNVSLGDYVRVPLGKKETVGVVWSLAGDADLDPSRVKFVLKKYAAAPMTEVQRKFIEWVARYTMADPGSVLKMSLSAPGALAPPKRARLITPPCQIDAVPSNSLVFSDSQQQAAASLTKLVAARGYSAVLLDGVTGSGKTEVYFEAVAEALRQGRQVLILLPEISLSAQFLERFERRFGVLPALWHSEVSPAQRRTVWAGVTSGVTRVVVGARSALFLPYANLGLVVVDEEHEASYKQEEGVLYHARDMAIVRAHLGNIPIVLVSATPSLETMINVKQGKYHYLLLSSRHAGAKMPEVQIIDLRKAPPGRGKFMSPLLQRALQETFAAQEQSLLFLNRRGYAPLTLCRHCGYRFQCPSCAAWLVDHRKQARMQCHHCGYSQQLPRQCPECSAEDSLAACGPGVERIQEEVTSLLPEARTLILASDVVTSPKMINEAVRQIEDHEVDVIIGTQIIAKGHHFPDLTCVGVVDADLGMAGGDLRAGERTFQLLHQVSGRAGRGAKPGRVYIQTFMPEQNVIRALAANDRDRFLDVEANLREKAAMPPYGRLAAIILSGADELKLDQFCRALAQRAPRFDDIRILGPAPAPLGFLRGKHRRRFLVKADRSIAIQKFLDEWLALLKAPSTIQVKVDIDPQSFF